MHIVPKIQNYTSSIKLNIQKIVFIVLFNIALINVFISTISNYSLNSYILKLIFIIISYFLIFIDFKINRFTFSYIIQSIKIKSLVHILLFFFVIPTVTLTYSVNFNFGVQKLLTMLSSTIPSILIAIYILLTFDEIKIKIVISSILFFSLLLNSYIIIIQPFNYLEPYHFSLLKWSPVIIGRFQGISFIIVLFLLIKESDFKQRIFFTLLIIIIMYSSYLTGLRSNFILILILSPYIIIYSILKKIIFINNLYLLLIIVMTCIVLIYYFPIKDPILIKKITSLNYFDKKNFGNDGSMQARIEFINSSFEMIKKRPIWGWGLGGFRIPYYNQFQYHAKYPHNILLESWIELGIVGFLLLIYFLTKTFLIIKKNILLLILFLYFLGLAFIAKDIPTNTFLWSFFAFLILNPEKRKDYYFTPDLNK